VTAAAALALLALTLGAGVPRLLRRLPLAAVPSVGIVLWLSALASSILAAVLAGVALAVPLPMLAHDAARACRLCLSALQATASAPVGRVGVAAGIAAATACLVRVAVVVVGGARTVAAERERQSDLLALVARQVPGLPDTVAVDHPGPVAYCIPGRRQRIVLSAGALETLEPDEIAAVVAHERAHLRGRHAAILAAAEVLARSFPFLPAFRRGRSEVARLIEMIADDAAARTTDRLTLASALLRLAPVRRHGVLAAAGSHTSERVARLLADRAARRRGSRIAGYGTATVMLASPLLLLFAPLLAGVLRDYCPVGPF
jgi:Zn-dependent protease with chaperone function